MRLEQVFLGLVTAVILSGCKIEITVPQNGRVESQSGTYVCESGETCIIDVVDAFFDETFQAKPAEGYTFTAWRKKDRALCGGRSSPCPLRTTGFPGTGLMQLLESDKSFYLEPVFRRPNTWTSRADMSTSGVGIATCTIGGKLYAMGLGWGSAAMLGRIEEYDPETDTWTPRASMPTPRAWITASAVKGKCYVIGGGDSGGPFRPPAFTTVEEYNPNTDSWRTRASLPQGRSSAGSAVVNGKIYVIGGGDAVWWDTPLHASVAIYDPSTDQWSTGADMPTPRSGLGVAAVNGLIYAVGGSNYDLDLISTNIVERYDPVKNQWTKRARMPVNRHFLTASAYNGKLYAVGGLINAGDTTSASVYRYDPTTNQWINRAGMSVPRYGIGSAVLNGQILVVGGRQLRESPPLTLTEEYTP
jgi:N-acetylneuraminic acid mutarotase